MTTKTKFYISTALFFPIIVSILLQFIPLTNTTGFEFSFLLSIPLFISGGLIPNAGVERNVQRFAIISVVAIPFVISVGSNIFFSICPLAFDILFYFVISVPAFIIGYFWGIFIYHNVKRVRAGYLLLSLIIILHFPFFEFYFLPQIYFYHPILGFFPGTIYDEHIAITWQLISYRVLIMFFFYLFSKMRCSQKENTYWSLVTIPLFLGIWFIFLKPWLGFSTTESRIEDELTNVFKTEHFQIYTDKEIGYDTTSLKNLHEFYYSEVASRLEIESDIQIKSFIFKNRRQKKELFGSEYADVAKPWLKQIYLDEENFTETLEHEIVHILAGEFGNKPLYVASYINPALIEGMAMAIENNFDDKEINYVVKLAVESGYNIEIEQLFAGLNFFGNVSSQSYLFAGSFLKYLAENYGVEAIKRLYNEGEFEQNFGKNRSELSRDFSNYISSLNYKVNKETAKLYFGRQPLIKKICPRIAARIEREGWELYADNNYEDAMEKFDFVFNSVGTYSALNGLVLAKIRLEKYEEALNLAEEKLPLFSNTSYFYNLELRIADLAVFNSDSLTAESAINKLLEQNPSINYYNEAVLRSLLLSNGIEFYANFLIADYADRFSMLTSFSDEPAFDSIIPKLTEYSRNIEDGYNQLQNILINYSPSLTTPGIFAAYNLSIYYYAHAALTEAEKFAVFAYENNKLSENQNVLSENYRLIQWSIGNNK